MCGVASVVSACWRGVRVGGAVSVLCRCWRGVGNSLARFWVEEL